MTDTEAWEYQRPLIATVFTSDAKKGPAVRREAGAGLERALT